MITEWALAQYFSKKIHWKVAYLAWIMFIFKNDFTIIFQNIWILALNFKETKLLSRNRIKQEKGTHCQVLKTLDTFVFLFCESTWDDEEERS